MGQGASTCGMETDQNPEKKVFPFLRFFGGHWGRSASFGRFAFADLSKVLKLIEIDNRYYVTKEFGRVELDGYYCVRRRDFDKWMCIRRKNGEAFWNIALIRSHAFHDFEEDEILEFVEYLKENDINVQMAKKQYEYIPPVTEEQAQPFRVEVSAWSEVDRKDIMIAQEQEAKWKKELEAEAKKAEAEAESEAEAEAEAEAE